MSAKDKVVEVRATEVPGMRITVQGPLSPDGLGIAFEVGVDSEIAFQKLDALLDKILDARRRQAAIEELPIVRQHLYAKRELLKTAKRAQAEHEARMSARTFGVRGRPVQPNLQDVNGAQQHHNTIMQIEEQIELSMARIPYLEALRDGRPTPDPLPAANDTKMAAE
jgi:hypothetical protein